VPEHHRFYSDGCLGTPLTTTGYLANEKRHGVVLVALLGVVLLGAVGPVSASAAECPGTVEGGGIALCSEGHELKGSFAFSGQKQSGTSADPFNLVGGGIPLTVSCSSAKFSKGSFVATAGKLEISGLYIEYGGCTVSSDEADCEVTPITVDGGEGKGTGPGLSASLTSTAQVTLLGGGANKRWTIFRVKGKPGHTCSATWEARIRGNATCSLPGSTTEAITHVVKCEYGKSELTNSEQQAGFELTGEVKLTSGKAWSLQKI
jgi:hypothetical protein